MSQVDLAIVGASFAGLSCATSAAARGISTVVMERKSAVGSSVHTTGILVKEAADLLDVPRRLVNKIHGIRLYSPGGTTIDLASPGYYFLATDTPGLLEWLARQAQQAGAGIRYGSAYNGSKCDCHGVHQLPADLSARYLVGCDGARSGVARSYSLGENSEFLFGLETEFSGVRGIADDVFHVFVDPQLAPGYIGWVIPGVHGHQIGLAARRPHKPQLDHFLHSLQRYFDFSHARQGGHRAGLIPCGGPVRRFAGDNVMLLGDAAGMVSPLTAGGIHPALQLGREAGIAIADYLQDNGPAPDQRIATLASRYHVKRQLRRCYDILPVNPRLIDGLFGLPMFRHLAQTVFFHHRGLLTTTAWKDLLGLVREQ
jgi:flavin-dependent dehydrogenase